MKIKKTKIVCNDDNCVRCTVLVSLNKELSKVADSINGFGAQFSESLKHTASLIDQTKILDKNAFSQIASLQKIEIPKIELPKIELLGFNNDILKLQRAFEEQAKFVANFKGYFANAFAHTQKLSNQFNEWKEFIENSSQNIDKILPEYHWFFSPALEGVSYSVINNAVIDSINEQRDCVFPVVKAFFEVDNWQVFDEMVKGWLNKPIDEDRKRLIKIACNAHKRGEYSLSITALLAQIEGLTRDYVRNLGINVSNDNESRSTFFVQSALSYKREKNAMVKCLKKLIDKMFFASKLAANHPVLNRHNVLHGKSVQFDSDENAYRVILMLDVIISYLF